MIFDRHFLPLSCKKLMGYCHHPAGQADGEFVNVINQEGPIHYIGASTKNLGCVQSSVTLTSRYRAEVIFWGDCAHTATQPPLQIHWLVFKKCIEKHVITFQIRKLCFPWGFISEYSLALLKIRRNSLRIMVGWWCSGLHCFVIAWSFQVWIHCLF